MSKRSEEAALKLFPIQMGLVPLPDGDTIEEDVNRWKRKLAKIVYEQAEQDLALTWEDLQTINDLFYQVDAENGEAWDYEVIEQDLPFPYGQKFYEEVLRRFREMKNK